MASVIINVLVLGGLLVAAQVAAVRRSSERLMADLRRELDRYRLVLLVPGSPVASEPAPTEQTKLRRATRKTQPEPKPLAIPDPRLLLRLDPSLASFIRENPEIEEIVTREIVRDLDSRILDAAKLLQESSIEISFEIDDAGHTAQVRVEKSSAVPSIDHLALEMVKLLEKYQLLAAMKGVRRVSASIRVDDRITVNLEGSVRESTEIEDAVRSVQGTLTLMRLALSRDAAFLLQDLSLTAEDNRLILRRVFEKEPLLTFLMLYYQPEIPK